MKATLRAYWLYAKYVARHKFYVFVAGLYFRVNWWQLLVHDLSKLGLTEWHAYAMKFYGPPLGVQDWIYNAEATYQSMQRDQAFRRAWLHHIHHNPHHWNYYVVVDAGETYALEMPDKYLREMMADWAGVGLALGGGWENIVTWYLKTRDGMTLHPVTEYKVIRMLHSLAMRNFQLDEASTLYALIPAISVAANKEVAA